MDDCCFHPGQLVHHHHYGICIVVRQKDRNWAWDSCFSPGTVEVFCLARQKRIILDPSKVELLPHT